MAEDDQRARGHFSAGESYYAEHRYDDAAREFGEAFALSGRPEMLLNQARALERAERPEEARAALLLLLERFPRTSYRPEVEASLGRLEAPAQESVPEAAPPPEAPEPAPAEAEPPAATVEPARRFIPGLGPIVLGSAAVALSVVSLATGLRAHAVHSDLSGRCPSGLCAADDGADIAHGRRLARASTALTFGALSLLGAAAAWWGLDVRRGRRAPRLDAALGRDAWEARLSWRL